MRLNLVPVSLFLTILMASTALVAATTSHASAPAAEVDEPSVTDHMVTSFDGTQIAISLFRPAGASEATPVPMVMQSHGWGGSRTSSLSGIVGALVAEGYGVVSIDARGHGDSGSFATVHSKDKEVKDFQAVLDWIYDNVAWAMKEDDSGIPKDLVLGGTGYSYGGGIQLQLASYDKRIDVIVPEITWNFLPYALAPNGAIKSVWVDILIGLAYQSSTRIDPRIEQWYGEALLTNAFSNEAYDFFVDSSPVVEDIDADILLIQGIPDVLFNLNHAMATYDTLQAKGTQDVRLFTHLTGHVLPNQPLGTSSARLLPFEEVGPCGAITDQVVGFLNEHLRGIPSGIPEMSFALDDGECVRVATKPANAVTFNLPAVAAPSTAGTLLVPLGSFEAVIAGIPHLKATVTPLVAPGMAYAGLVIVSANGYSRVVDDQTQPIPLVPGESLDTDLVGVAARMNAGDQLFLRIEGLNEWSAHNSARVPGGAVFTDLEVTVPVV